MQSADRDEKSGDTSAGGANSLNVSPMESDCEEDDEEGGTRGSDDDLAIAGTEVGHRKKKTRTVFSRQQVSQLEMTFDMKRYLSSQERAHLASTLRLTETQVSRFPQSISVHILASRCVALSRTELQNILFYQLEKSTTFTLRGKTSAEWRN